MTSKAFQPFLLVASAVLATMLGTASAQAQNTNTTIQEGRVCINRTSQYGDSNDNATYQTCKVNINRTVQRGKENSNATAQFGRHNSNETHQSRGFKRTGYNSARSDHNKPGQHRSKRGRDHRGGARNRDK
jgi:hypothetical protein